MTPTRILIVRLPCRKVYPTGPVYLLSTIHRAAPRISMRLLDLALVARDRRMRRLEAAVEELRPELIAFSWRDIQIFSPQDVDGGLRDAFIFFHDPSVARKLGASFRGLRDIFMYKSALAHNLDLIREAARKYPDVEIALGGSSVKIFGDWLGARLPPRVRLFPDSGLGPFFDHLGLSLPVDPIEPGIDMDFLESAFPQWEAYRDEVIGIQTKQGCPHACLYCLYGYLEGKIVRRRESSAVVEEMLGYARRWGARRFWLADAQLLSEQGDREHLRRVLEGMLGAGLDLGWSGYLRIHEIEGSLASLMVRSGLGDLEISLGSGAQRVLDELKLGFSVEEVMRGCEILKRAGYAGRVLVNLSLNAPGETGETLLETMDAVRRIRGIFGDRRVVPIVFFLAIQPHTGLERRALADGHIKKGYDPLSVLPWEVPKLIYNPPPLGAMIGRACALAFRKGGDDVGERILASLENGLRADSRKTR